MKSKLSAALAAVGCALVSFASTANASTYTYDLSFNVLSVTITGEITTNCDNCGLTNSNILSWAVSASTGNSATSATPGASMSFGGSSVLVATPSALNFTIGAFGIMSFNGPIGTVAVQFNTVGNPYPLCSTSNGCEIAILPNGVTDIAYVTENQQVGRLAVSSVPGPIAGAGLPGLVIACGGLLVWYRRRQSATQIAA